MRPSSLRPLNVVAVDRKDASARDFSSAASRRILTGLHDGAANGHVAAPFTAARGTLAAWPLAVGGRNHDEALEAAIKAGEETDHTRLPAHIVAAIVLCEAVPAVRREMLKHMAHTQPRPGRGC